MSQSGGRQKQETSLRLMSANLYGMARKYAMVEVYGIKTGQSRERKRIDVAFDSGKLPGPIPSNPQWIPKIPLLCIHWISIGLVKDRHADGEFIPII
jgi:hypothetical protein